MTVVRERRQAEIAAYLRAWERHGIRWDVPAAWSGGCSTACHLDVRPSLLAPEEHARLLLSRCTPDVPATVRVRHDTLIYRYPHGHPDRALRGQRNDRYLDAGWWTDDIAPVLQSLGKRVHVVALMCAPVFATEDLTGEAWCGVLDRFLGGLPAMWRYAVNAGTRRFLLPLYRDCLAAHGSGHVLCRDSLAEDLTMPGVYAPETVVVSAGPAPELAAAVARGVEERKAMMIHLDEENGGAPALVEVLHLLDPVLAALSPLRTMHGRRAA